MRMTIVTDFDAQADVEASFDPNGWLIEDEIGFCYL